VIADAPGPGGRSIRIDDGILDAHRGAIVAHGPAAAVRVAFAATRVVMRASYASVPHSRAEPGSPGEIEASIDWDATLALRTRLDRLGFGVAEAMDTAQRFELGWRSASRLIRECGALRLAHGFVAGAGVDHLPVVRSESELIDGVVHQVEIVQEHGGIPILLPMPQLVRWSFDADGYVRVYERIAARCEGPLLVHWLGEMFLPELRGYFPGDSFDRVMALDPAVVRGCKLSLLDDALELRVRRALLPRGQVVLTGDDFHFAALIRGGTGDRVPPVEGFARLGTLPVALGDFSHALLGVLDAIAVPAALGLRLLALGDAERYQAVMAPCEELGRHVFAAPTPYYKAGLAFLAWLNGLQDQFMLVNHAERGRDRAHYLRCAELAARAGALEDAELAAARVSQFAADPSWR
jgi:hypothetical protein